MNGDFVQRHAQAASLFCKVQVIHLEADKNFSQHCFVETTFSQQGNLSETIILYRLHKGLYAISKIISWWRYIRLFKKCGEKLY